MNDEPGELPIADTSSNDALDEVMRLQKRAWADRRPSSVPLIVFGSLVILYAPLINGGGFGPRFLYWLIAGPVGFFLCAAWYRHRRTVTGVGAGRGNYLTTGVVVLAAFVLVIPLLIMALPTIGLALFVIAFMQRNTYLAVCAIFFAVVGFFATILTFDNLLYRAAYHLGFYRASDGYFSGASAVVYVVWGVLMLIAGLVALKREVSVANAEQ